MKKTLIIMFIVLSPSVCMSASWLDNWSVNGIELRRFHNINKIEALQLVGGAITSALVHTASHYVCGAVMGIGMEQDSNNILIERFDEKLDTQQNTWMGMSGMLGQNMVGTILNNTKFNNTFFSAGYNIWSFIEISTYPMIFGFQDLEGDKNPGPSDLNFEGAEPFWYIMTAWSINNLK